jgi:methionine-rich copper-binding protein CopC
MPRFPAGLAVLLAALVGSAAAAEAHARLMQTTPADGSTVAAPTEIRLKFDEPVETGLSGLDLATAAGGKIATGAAAEDPADAASLVIPVADALKAGAYKVHWHAVSDDMHKVQGDFTFTVGP